MAVDAPGLAIWDTAARGRDRRGGRRELHAARLVERAASTSARCVDRRLVDQVAAELVELGREQVARSQRPPRGGATGSPSTATRSSSAAERCVSCTCLRSRERSQPASRSASAFGPVTESFSTFLISGHSAASRPRQPTARPQAMSETAIRSKSCRELRVGAGEPAPLRRVDDEPVADVDELLQLRLAPGRQPAPAAEGRQVGDQQRLDDRAGHAGALVRPGGARSRPSTPRVPSPRS